MATHLKILNQTEIHTFDFPPEFNGEEEKQDMINTIKSGSVVTWQHINLQREYDFSEKTLENSYDFKLPDLLDLKID